MINIKNKGVVIIDFGSQYTKLIARELEKTWFFQKFFRLNPILIQ